MASGRAVYSAPGSFRWRVLRIPRVALWAMRLQPVAQVVQKGTQFAERFRVELRTLPAKCEWGFPGSQVCPVHGDGLHAAVRNADKDARTTKVTDLLQQGERAAREGMERVGNHHRISRPLRQ